MLEETDVSYILFVFEVEEFIVMVGENKLHTDISFWSRLITWVSQYPTWSTSSNVFCKRNQQGLIHTFLCW